MNDLDFSNILTQWYSNNKRDLPWRTTNEPYKIWLSEIILQQTRVNQGLDYYNKFIEKYPSVYDLAQANEHEVLKLWQGLGYYSRARNMHFTARYIVNTLNGKFPRHSKELKKLKGIGEYTAAAIASFCFHEPIAVIDGNVYRVLSRIFNIDTPIDSNEGIKQFRELANININKEQPDNYNQAIMDFGAIQCTPVNPDCNGCPFNHICEAFHKQKVEQLPVKSKKIKKKTRHLYYIVPQTKNHTYISQRTQKDVWRNLYEFPLIEFKENKTIEKLILTHEWNELFKNEKIEISSTSKTIKYQLTHQTLQITFIEILLPVDNKLDLHFKKIDKMDIFDLPVSKVIENYIHNNWFFRT